MADGPVTAADLRRHMVEIEMERMRALEAKKAAADRAAHDFADHFLHDHLTKQELAAGKAKVIAAVENGHFEALVMRFPASLCTDGGRAINNALEGWEQTLPGKAGELYRLWRERGRAAGYHFRAEILNYPNGMLGDVGIFWSWAAPAV